VFRSGPAPLVRAAGPDIAAAHRLARIAGLPFGRERVRHGLAAWTSSVRPRPTSIVVDPVGERVPARRAVRPAYALDRLGEPVSRPAPWRTA
jgi:hypothetical protein